MSLLQTPTPPLPPGRKIVTCCIGGCTERVVSHDDVLRVICWKHSTTHNFPRDEQADLDITLPETPSAPGPQPSALI